MTSQSVSTGVGLGRSLPVHLSNLDSNNLRALLDFRNSLVANAEDETQQELHDRANQAGSTARGTADTLDQHTAARIRHPEFRPLTSELRRRVIELYGMNIPLQDIARDVGINRSTIHRLRKQEGLSRKPRFTDADRQRAAQLRRQGMTLVEIATELGFCRNTIQRQLSRRREACSG